MDYIRLGRRPLLKSASLKFIIALGLLAIFTVLNLGTFPRLESNGVGFTSSQKEIVDADVDTAGGSKSATIQPKLRPQSSCYLPDDLAIPPSEDGTYTPPAPDQSLAAFLRKLSESAYDIYCQEWHRRQVIPPEQNDYNRHGECGTWQEDYIQLHQQGLSHLQNLKAGVSSQNDGKRHKYLAYVCNDVATGGNRGCGGLADRMSGMISTFFFALLTGRTYMSYWYPTNPLPLDYVFEHPFIDWRLDPKVMKEVFTDVQQMEAQIDSSDERSMRKLTVLNGKTSQIDMTYFPDGPMQDFNDLWDESYLEISSNRAFIVRTFQVSKRYPSILEAMGLLKGNAFGCITDFLFRPTVGARRFIDTYKDVFELDSVFSVGIQIRTGDAAIVNPELDTLTLDQYSYFLTCANQLAETHRQAHQTHAVFFFITDSARLRDEFTALNHDPRLARQYGLVDTTILTTGLPIDHLEPRQVAKYINITHPQEKTPEESIPGTNSAIIENWLLSYTDYRVISRQGYGKMAAYHSNKDGTTVMMPRLGAKDKVPDCRLPSAFTSFDELAGLWSLG